LHISLGDWALGLAAALAYVLALQLTPLPPAAPPLVVPFDVAAAAAAGSGPLPICLWPTSMPAGPAPPPARALLEGRAALIAIGRPAALAARLQLALAPLALPLPFLPLPRFLRADAAVSLELALRGAPAPSLELCVAVEDAYGVDLSAAAFAGVANAASEPCGGSGGSGGGSGGAARGRRLALPARGTAAVSFKMPPGAKLGVTLGGGGAAGFAGELRLSVAAADAEGAYVVIMR